MGVEVVISRLFADFPFAVLAVGDIDVEAGDHQSEVGGDGCYDFRSVILPTEREGIVVELRLCGCLYSLDKILGGVIGQVVNGDVSHKVRLIVRRQSAVAVTFISGHRNDRDGVTFSEGYAVGETAVTLLGCCHTLYRLCRIEVGLVIEIGYKREFGIHIINFPNKRSCIYYRAIT
ncbi:MAG: hypothetical protein HDR88_11930 [Bacteroides sp.]|nr:hypothetical protein [Bacteroides sp.]